LGQLGNSKILNCRDAEALAAGANCEISQLQNYNFLGGMHMQVFHIRYRNTQGTLMRILNAVSRRGLDLTSVQAQAGELDHGVTLLLEVNPKQVGQLHREWYSIVDVTNVRAGLTEPAQDWGLPHPPASEGANGKAARAALA
jgi:acetolactate synthase regulatory subunit